MSEPQSQTTTSSTLSGLSDVETKFVSTALSPAIPPVDLLSRCLQLSRSARIVLIKTLEASIEVEDAERAGSLAPFRGPPVQAQLLVPAIPPPSQPLFPYSERVPAQVPVRAPDRVQTGSAANSGGEVAPPKGKMRQTHQPKGTAPSQKGEHGKGSVRTLTRRLQETRSALRTATGDRVAILQERIKSLKGKIAALSPKAERKSRAMSQDPTPPSPTTPPRPSLPESYSTKTSSSAPVQTEEEMKHPPGGGSFLVRWGVGPGPPPRGARGVAATPLPPAAGGASSPQSGGSPLTARGQWRKAPVISSKSRG